MEPKELSEKALLIARMMTILRAKGWYVRIFVCLKALVYNRGQNEIHLPPMPSGEFFSRYSMPIFSVMAL
jgi:hypothetical protein